MSFRLARRVGVSLLLTLCALADAAAQQPVPTREELDGHLARLVTEMRADVPDLEQYEPLLVLHILHDERGYRVQASDLLERRLTDALAAQRIRVIDQSARQRILEDLEDCYTEEAPFCRASDVVGQFQTAGGLLEGSVLPVRFGTELRMKLVVAAGATELSPGEIVGTWSVVVPPPSLDPVGDLLPAAGVVAFGRPPADSVSPSQLGELRVDVRTQDGSLAWVQIDERVVVPAPVTTTTAAGEHLLTVTASGHRPYSGYVDVTPRGLTRRDIVLERGVGSVRILSNAPAATVYLDERRVGTTPWQGKEIETGPHHLRVESDGYAPLTQHFVLEHSEAAQIDAQLIELPGDIVISCLHDDVTVFMDDPALGPVGACSTGRTLTLTDVAPGIHRIWGMRGSDRTLTQTVTVRGGQTIPLSLALRLDLPPGARDANERTGNRQYDAYGGNRLPRGLYLDLGFIAGQAEWQMTLDDFDFTAKPTGIGGRFAASMFSEIWELMLGGDLVFLESFEEFSSGRFFDLFLGATWHAFPGSPVRPFLGARGLYNSLSFDDPLRVGDSRVTGGGFGVGGHGGVNIRLGPSTALELGASYTWVAPRDLRGETSPGGFKENVGRVEDWQFVSGFAAVWIHVR